MRPEIRLATSGARAAALLIVPAALAGLLVAGGPGALGAGTGAAGVTVLALAPLPLYRTISATRPQAVVPIALAALGLRLALAAVALVLASGVPAVSSTSLGLSTVVALAAAQVAEMRVAARDPRLSWLHVTPRVPHTAHQVTHHAPDQRTAA